MMHVTILELQQLNRWSVVPYLGFRHSLTGGRRLVLLYLGFSKLSECIVMSKCEDMQNPFAILSEKLNRIESLLRLIILNQQSSQQPDGQTQSDTGIELAVRVTGYKRKTYSTLS